MSDRVPVPTLPAKTMLALSALQGLAFTGLWLAFDNDAWLALTPVAFFPLCTLAVVWPTVVLLSIDAGDPRRLLGYSSAFAGVLALLGAYIGWQATPYGEFPIAFLVVGYVATLLVGCFFALIHLQRRTSGQPMAYEALYAYAWRNVLVVGLSALLTLAVGALLALWAAIFLVLGIEQFADVFAQPWFVLPVLSVAFGGGVVASRRRSDLIDGVTVLLEGLTRYLLPMVLVIVVVFIIALPFVSLRPLWETGHGSVILLILNGVALVLVNAAYRTGRELPYRPVLHRCVSAAILLLPVVSALALYGIGLRVAQYGWTVERCWAFTGAALFGVLSIGYAVAVVLRRGRWHASLARFNTRMGWVVIALMLLANSPVLDFRSISVVSQLARVESGELELGEFDFRYARDFLARPGYLKTRPLVAELGFDPAKTTGGANASGGVFVSADVEHERDSRDFWGSVTYRPEGLTLPGGVRHLVEQHMWFIDDPVVIELDLNGDGDMEYAVLGSYRRTEPDFRSVDFGVGVKAGWTERALAEEFERALEQADQVVSYVPTGWVVRRDGDDWKFKTLRFRSANSRPADSPDVIPNALRRGGIEMVRPELDNLQVGHLFFHVSDAEAWTGPMPVD